MGEPRWSLHVLLLALAGLGLLVLAVSTPAQADHPAERAILIVIDGPRHDLAFDEQGPLSALYAMDNVTVGSSTWTAGPARTVPGHAALLTGRPQAIDNDGSERPEGPLLWETLAEEHGWSEEQMRWLYQKDKLAVLDTEHAGGGPVQSWAPDEAMLEAIEANRSDPHVRLLAASFLWPDHTGHDGDWEAHEASLSTIATQLAPMLEEEAGPDTLVIVTADHARFCEDPEDHGRLGPLGPADDCDAHIPLFAMGWHIRKAATVDDCLTQADLAVLVVEALGSELPEASGRFPHPLVNASVAWQQGDCPPDRGGLPFPTPLPGAPSVALVLGVVALAVGLRRSRR